LASDGKYYYEDTSETLEGKTDSQVFPKHKTSYKGFSFDEKAPNVTSGTVKAD
jgi:hypothetical protein